MTQLRCTSCNRRLTREEAVRADFKCPDCGGVALLDWTAPEPGAGKGRLRRALSRRRRTSTGPD